MSASMLLATGRGGALASPSVRLMGALVLALVVVPLLFPFRLGLMLSTQVCIAIVACLSFNLLYGQGGMLGFAHAVPIGLGAYVAVQLLAAMPKGGLRVPAELLPLLAGVAGALVSWLIGLVAARHAGTAFAMITLGIGELVHSAVSMMSGWFGGEGGVSGDRSLAPALPFMRYAEPLHLYALVACFTVLSAFAMWAYVRTPAGYALAAVRENAERAAFVGLRVRRVRLQAMVVAGFFAGVAGGLSALLLEIATPDALSPAKSASILLFTVLGGTRHAVGPVIGALLMVLCTALLPGWTDAWLLYLGVAFMAMMVVEPGGVAALLARGVSESRRLHGLTSPWPSRAVMARRACSACCLLLMLASSMVLVQMLYRRQFDLGTPQPLRLPGVTLDVSAASSWWLVLALLVVALVGWRWARRR